MFQGETDGQTALAYYIDCFKKHPRPSGAASGHGGGWGIVGKIYFVLSLIIPPVCSRGQETTCMVERVLVKIGSGLPTSPSPSQESEELFVPMT